jgi:menaquinone-dependent protoporphyrinogen IX oxidase
MRVGLVYYSRTGHTKQVITEIADNLIVNHRECQMVGFQKRTASSTGKAANNRAIEQFLKRHTAHSTRFRIVFLS